MTRHSGCYDSEGRFRGVPHTHLHTRPISGLLEFAMASRDQDFIEYSKKSYEYARDSSGSATVGFFPSTPGAGQQYSAKMVQQVARYGVEGCTIADMAALAIKLSLAGAGDYWDDADRYLRNQFAEMQLLKGDFVNRLLPEDRYETWNRPEFESSDRAVERNIGSAMSLASPNDFVGHPLTWPDRPDSDHLFLMHCCTGNHARAIWYDLAAPSPPSGRGPEGESASQPVVALGGRPELHPLRGAGRREGQAADLPPGSDSRLDRT